MQHVFGVASIVPSGSSWPPGPRARRLAVFGAFIGLLTPLGWLVVQLFRGISPLAEIAQDPPFWAYLLAAATLAMTSFGWVLGGQEDRLLDLNRQLDRLTITDPLTSLRNRRYFMQRLEDAIAQLGRGGESLAVAIVDLDRFKHINDRHGHLVGDRLLRAAAQSMRRVARRGEVIARIGGEEFGVILPNADAVGAYRAAERLRQAVHRSSARFPGGKVRVTASVGVILALSSEGATPSRLLLAADRALYAAKHAGRNRAVVRCLPEARRIFASGEYLAPSA